jgi:hypothetical protein
MTSLVSLRLNDPPNDTVWQYCRVASAFLLLSTNVGKEMPISRIVVVVPNATDVLLDSLIEVRENLVCCLVVTCLLHFGGTFLVRVRFFERPSFVRVTSPNRQYCQRFRLSSRVAASWTDCPAETMDIW